MTPKRFISLFICAALIAGLAVAPAAAAPAAADGAASAAKKKKKKCKKGYEKVKVKKKNGKTKTKCKKKKSSSGTTASEKPAQLTVTPTGGNFDRISMGQVSNPLTFVVANVGDKRSGTIGASLSGGPNFQLLDNCAGSTLGGGDSCNVKVSFGPTSLGEQTASVTVGASPGGSHTIPLRANGITAADLTVNPNAWAFPDTLAVLGFSDKSFFVNNTGDSSTGPLNISVSNTQPMENNFVILSEDCPTFLAFSPAGFCNIVVRFDPATVGAKTGSLNVSASPGGNVVVPLSGNGI